MVVFFDPVEIVNECLLSFVLVYFLRPEPHFCLFEALLSLQLSLVSMHSPLHLPLVSGMYLVCQKACLVAPKSSCFFYLESTFSLPS